MLYMYMHFVFLKVFSCSCSTGEEKTDLLSIIYFWIFVAKGYIFLLIYELRDEKSGFLHM